MPSNAPTPEAFLEELPEDRKAAVANLRQVIRENLPEGFAEVMSYGMLAYVVPHSSYPAGYHCDPAKPLPFISIASQKGHISLHHLALYEGSLLDWLTERWGQVTTRKLDMGKGCIRFKKPDQIPFELIGELASKLTPEEWVARYEQAFKRK